MRTPNAAPKMLESSFSLSGKIKSAENDVHILLQRVPFIKSSSKELQTYSINNSKGEKIANISFLKNELRLKYHFPRFSLKEYTKGLLLLLSILPYLEAAYEPDLSSLYPIVTGALTEYIKETIYPEQKIENGNLLMHKIGSLSEMNSSLSLQILTMEELINKLNAEKEILSSFSKGVISNSIEKIGNISQQDSILPKVLGVSSQLCEAVRRISANEVVE